MIILIFLPLHNISIKLSAAQRERESCYAGGNCHLRNSNRAFWDCRTFLGFYLGRKASNPCRVTGYPNWCRYLVFKVTSEIS